MRKNSTKSRDGLYAQDTTGPDSGSDIKSGDEGIDSIGTKFDSIGDGLFDNVYDEMNPRTGKADGEDSTKTPMAKMEDDLEKQWESMEQMGNELMYGASSTRKSVLAKEFLREQHVERLIPKRFLENLHRFETPKLEHESVKGIREDYESTKKVDFDVLNTSIFSEVYREKIERMIEEGRDGLEPVDLEK